MTDRNCRPTQIELFLVERQTEYRSQSDYGYPLTLALPDTRALVFGFVAAVLERLPLIGIVFSLSNRIGAAMWAHGQSAYCVLALSSRSDALLSRQISRNSSISSRKANSVKQESTIRKQLRSCPLTCQTILLAGFPTRKGP